MGATSSGGRVRIRGEGPATDPHDGRLSPTTMPRRDQALQGARRGQFTDTDTHYVYHEIHRHDSTDNR